MSLTRLIRMSRIALVLSLGCVPFWAMSAPPAGNMTCAPETRTQISCAFQTVDPGKPTTVRLQINGKAIKAPDVTAYPASDETTAILFLVDISDPARAATVASNVAAIRTLVDKLPPHQKIGLATFDSNFTLLAPIGSSRDKLNAALATLRAGGAATEFYKNILAGSKTLDSYAADRKALVLFSDGKAEDRAYGRDDAVKALSDAHISVIGLGYAETPADLPSLQTIERLSKETGGAFFAASQARTLPENFYRAPFSSVESGGRFRFDRTRLSGTIQVKADILAGDRALQSFTVQVDANANRSFGQNLIAFVKAYWPFLLGGLFVLALGITLLIRHRRRRMREMPVAVDYGFLEEMDGQGTQYPLTRTAIRIGRSEENDIQLNNGSVSRHHAELNRRDDGWHIVDLASTNGVRVNDAPVSAAPLKSSDILEIGEVRFRFVEY